MKIMIHFIYKTTNIVNNKIYVGRHSTKNENDGYLGSGTVLTRAIKKYGKEKFKREILEYVSAVEELESKEREWIAKEKCKKPYGYNLTDGGECGINTEEQRAAHSENTKKGMRKDPDYLFKLSERQKTWAKEHPEAIDEWVKKMEQWRKEHPEEMEKHRRATKELWNTEERKEYCRQRAIKQFTDPEQRRRNAEKAKGNSYRAKTYIITFPDGHEETIKGLGKFCDTNGLSLGCMLHVASGEQYCHKNFKCRRVGETPNNVFIEQRRNIPHYEVMFPDGRLEIIKNLPKFCEKHNLTRSAMGMVAQGLRKQHKMFRCRRLDRPFNNINFEQDIKPHSFSYEIIFPDGHTETIKSLQKFCDQYDLTRQAMSEVARGKIKHHKNFKCVKLDDSPKIINNSENGTIINN